jgi:hypothetical protein
MTSFDHPHALSTQTRRVVRRDEGLVHGPVAHSYQERVGGVSQSGLIGELAEEERVVIDLDGETHVNL